MATDQSSSGLRKVYWRLGTFRSWLRRLHPKPFWGVVFVAFISALITQCLLLVFVDLPNVRFARVIDEEQAITAIRLDIVEQMLNDRPITYERLVINYSNKANAHGRILFEKWESFWRFWEDDHVPAIRLTLLQKVIHPMDHCLRPPGRRFEVPTKNYVVAVSPCIRELGLETVLNLPGTDGEVDQGVSELKTHGSSMVEMEFARTLTALITVRDRLAVIVDQGENGLHVAGERKVLEEAIRLADGYSAIRAATANPDLDSRAIDVAATVRVEAHRAALEEWLNDLGDQQSKKDGADNIELTRAVKHRVANVLIYMIAIVAMTLLTGIGRTGDIPQAISDLAQPR